MYQKSWMHWIITGLLIGNLFLSPAIRGAEKPKNLVAVRDVSLSEDGSLRGSLLTPDGKPQANADVVLRKGTEVVGTAKTQIDGSFVMRQVRPGLYELISARSANLFRVWNSRGAPPAAMETATIVQGDLIVRGQEWSPGRRALILGGVIVTSGVIGGVIGYNIKDDDSAS